MKKAILLLIGVLLGMPVLYVVCFHFGWGQEVRSAPWIIWTYLAAVIYGVCAGVAAYFLPTDKPLIRAAMAATYYIAIFLLSCLAIIYGWGMYPRSWIVIIVCYACAAFLPPFSSITKQLRFWHTSAPTIPVLRADLEAWRDEFLFFNGDGETDCVTPFDKYFYAVNGELA